MEKRPVWSGDKKTPTNSSLHRSAKPGALFDEAVLARDALRHTPLASPADIRKVIWKPSPSSTPTLQSKSLRNSKAALRVLIPCLFLRSKMELKECASSTPCSSPHAIDPPGPGLIARTRETVRLGESGRLHKFKPCRKVSQERRF